MNTRKLTALIYVALPMRAKCSPFVLTCILIATAYTCLAQEKDRWRRIYTGEEFVIEILASSLKFEPDGILRARFRTRLTSSHRIPPLNQAGATQPQSQERTTGFN